MGGTFIITSGAYAGPDFVSTFGLLPPAFLPVGNQRLYELQAELIDKNDSRKIISVPDDFMIEDHERARRMALGFDIIPVKTGISLGASIAQVLEKGRVTSGKLEILHGDTYIHNQMDHILALEWLEMYFLKEQISLLLHWQ